MTLTRLVIGSIGVALLSLVVYLGYLTGQDSQRWVVPFGVASAIGAPIGLSLVGVALSARRNRALETLATAGDLERRVAEAKTYEQRVDVLQSQERQLEQLIQNEARRLAIEDRASSLEAKVAELVVSAEKILKEMDVLDEERAKLDGFEATSPAVRQAVERLRTRLQARLRAPDWNDLLLDSVPSIFGMRAVVRIALELAGRRRSNTGRT